MMRKIRTLLRAAASALIAAAALNAVPAYAYNVVDLPPEMTMAEALEIYDVSEIKSATVSELNDDKYITLSEDEIKDFYYSAQNVSLVRRINPTPFRGINVNFYTDSGVKTFNLTSGVQIGRYGSDNYMCYAMKDEDMMYYMYLDSMYHESENKQSGTIVVPRTENDFLKLPEDPWAVSSVQEAAARSLLPYELTYNYNSYISREYFCKLLGNFIAVTAGYSSIENYMIYNGIPYDTGAFADCAGRDSSICILHALGIVNGKDGVYFDPEGVITREEAAKLVTETANRFIFVRTNYRLEYDDQDQISDWAQFYVTWVTDKGIMGGVDSSNFAPKDYYTQQQAIATITRLYNVCK
ncbi:MAG: S-layer homology domain-containing protein [bacterium]|nr:S-layer homology domain-containing protein [bacterium]